MILNSWEQFDTWFYDRSPVYRPDLDFSGTGIQEMGESEVDALRRWAEAVYRSLRSRSARGRRADPSSDAIPGTGVGLDFHGPLSPGAHAVCLNPRFSCHLH